MLVDCLGICSALACEYEIARKLRRKLDLDLETFEQPTPKFPYQLIYSFYMTKIKLNSNSQWLVSAGFYKLIVTTNVRKPSYELLLSQSIHFSF